MFLRFWQGDYIKTYTYTYFAVMGRHIWCLHISYYSVSTLFIGETVENRPASKSTDKQEEYVFVARTSRKICFRCKWKSYLYKLSKLYDFPSFEIINNFVLKSCTTT